MSKVRSKFKHWKKLTFALLVGAPTLVGLVSLAWEGQLPSLVDSIINSIGFLDIRSSNLRFVLTTVATAQASILAIVFSVTFLSIQLVSTNYTLRTLGQFDSSHLFSEAYPVLFLSILYDVTLIVFLPQTLLIGYLWLGISAGILFLASIVSLGFAVNRTLELSTPSGLAAFIRQAANPRKTFAITSDRKQNNWDDTNPNQRATDPLHSLINSAVQNDETNTVKEVHDTYNDMIDDHFDVVDKAGVTRQSEQQRTWCTILGLSSEPVARHAVIDQFSAVIQSEYEPLLISSINTGNEAWVDDFSDDIATIGERSLDRKLPEIAETAFDTLRSVKNPGDRANLTIGEQRCLFQARTKLLISSVNHGYDDLALNFTETLKKDYENFNSNAQATSLDPDEIEERKAIYRNGINAVCQALLTLIERRQFPVGQHTPTAANFKADVSKTDGQFLYRELIGLQRTFHQFIIVDEADELDKLKKPLFESWIALFETADTVGRRHFIIDNIRYLAARMVSDNNETSQSETAYTTSIELFARISMSIGLEKVMQLLAGCSELADNSAFDTNGPIRTDARSNQLVSFSAESSSPTELFETAQNRIRAEYEALYWKTYGHDTACDAFSKHCSRMLGESVSPKTNLSKRTFLCETDDGRSIVVTLTRVLSEETIEEVCEELETIHESVLHERRNLEFRILTCTRREPLPENLEMECTVEECRFSNFISQYQDHLLQTPTQL
ncbi:hypothetical protein [Natrinema sp. CGMCC1.2065]|uniref:hypothetical protein n=1 Tax=Natrinema sp. CGMCC1.2065 TaxID=3445767 RepID=UPI003F4A79A9